MKSGRALAWVIPVIALGTVVGANVGGAIYTTLSGGQAVNANIYAAKADVYLNGGPQNLAHPGLSPDGDYYFQVTDPSGARLLSTDPVGCRVVRVRDGRVAGVPNDGAGGFGTPGCYHVNGTANGANGSLPVQLLPYADTPNPGGEYKVWLTPVAAYDADCGAQGGSFGFCNNESKTDNFKVRTSDTTGYVVACKFNDADADGEQDPGEPFLPHWPITASGVDNGTVSSQTGEDGCVSFPYSGFSEASPARVVTLTEGTFGSDWRQTAPASCGTLPNCQVSNGVIQIELRPGTIVQAPSFGNHNPYCDASCRAERLVSTADAFASLTRTYLWTIEKTVDSSRLTTSSENAPFTYTVSVGHDRGTDSSWKLTGKVRTSNPTGSAATATLSITATAGGACTIGGSVTIAAGSHEDVPYSCSYSSAPGIASVEIAVTVGDRTTTATASADFAQAAVQSVNGEVAVSDSMAGALGTATAADPSPVAFTYTKTIAGVRGTCTKADNTARFTAAGTGLAGSASKSVELCIGADPVATNVAAASYQSAIDKTVAAPVIQQLGGAPKFAYTVTVTQSGWTVTGTVQVQNPNDWQTVTAAVAPALPGATCVADAASISIAPGGTVAVGYRCAFTSAPPPSGTVTVAVTWDAAAAATPSGQAQAAASYQFGMLNVTDTFQGVTIPLMTIASPQATTVYSYEMAVPNAPAGSCRTFTNLATIVETGATASRSAMACNTATGAHTIGFWQNKNGQSVITSSASSAAGCAVGAWLRGFTPFQDLAPGANCSAVANYTGKVIKAASAAGESMNPMLKAQMLATALDVYFSEASLGGNRLGAPLSIGTVQLSLAEVCAAIGSGACAGTVDASVAFGGAASMTPAAMLAFQNAVATAGGSIWYGNDKALQALAKNAFDAINNQVARIRY